MMLGEDSMSAHSASVKGTDALSPVLIPIVPPSNNDATTLEWAMIEINGELLGPSSNIQVGSTTDINHSTLFDTNTRMELGSISFSEDETPVMIIGTHELRGSLVKLTQPFLVLQKVTSSVDDTTTDAIATTAYQMTGIVHYKLLFNQYPKTIMR